MIDIKLETLIKVHECGSFSKAAELLSLTQPAISQHIKQLEKELDTKLFNRNEKVLKITAEGEIVLKFAKRIQTLYTNMHQSLKDEKRNITSLCIGITHTAESNLMAQVLARYSAGNHGIHITMISDTINNLYSKLKTYEIDLAIVEGKIADNNFNSILLDTDSLLLAVPLSNPLSNKSIVTLNELKKENLILRLPSSATRNLFNSQLESNLMSLDEFNITLQVDNIATIKDLVRHNFGVSILAKSAFLNEIKKGKLKGLPIENLSMIREINMIYHKDFEYTNILHDITEIYYNYNKDDSLY